MNTSPKYCHDCIHRMVDPSRNHCGWRCGKLGRLSPVTGEMEYPTCITVRNANPYSENADLLLWCGPQGKLWEKKT
jgi:hypothetical protein